MRSFSLLTRRFSLLTAVSALAFTMACPADESEACESASDCADDEVCEDSLCVAPLGLGSLGFLGHTLGDVNFSVKSTAAEGLNGPRDLDFNPEMPGELWVVNRTDDSTVTYFDYDDDDNRSSLKLVDSFAMHFMEEVSSISFAENQLFGTCQESRNTYNNQTAANDFMGPALWSSDFEIYSFPNPDAVDFVGLNLGSHLDMLHESPLCMGIAWASNQLSFGDEFRNVYYTFDGDTNSISRYDFVEDHGAGYDEHDDGIVNRYVEADVLRVADIPSHMVYDETSDMLYIADTGNARILAFDTDSGAPLYPLTPLEPGVELFQMEGGDFTTLVSQEDGEFDLPSGIALQDGILYVTDNGTSRISAFDLEGNRIDYLDTELPAGSLMGIRVDELGQIWTVDFEGNQLIKVSSN